MAMQKIVAREILDSRGNPTVEVDLHTAKGNRGPSSRFASEHPQSRLLLLKGSRLHPVLCQRFLSPDSSFTGPLLLLALKLGEAGVSLYFLLSLGPWVQGGAPRPL